MTEPLENNAPMPLPSERGLGIWRLGESIVGGTVTPDTFVVRKSDLAITNRAIADKPRMTISAPRGTHEVEVPRFMRRESSLAHEQATEMARLSVVSEAVLQSAFEGRPP